MKKQEVEQETVQDFQDLVKQIQRNFKENKSNHLDDLKINSAVLHRHKFKNILDVFLKNTGLYSKIQYITNRAVFSDEMSLWSMSFVSTTESKMCRFSYQGQNIDFKVPDLEEQVELICPRTNEYFGVMLCYYQDSKEAMMLETAVCVNLLLTILETKKKEAA